MRRLLMFLALFGSSSIVYGLTPENITDGELALVPNYCYDTQTIRYYKTYNVSPRAKYWVGLMGEDFWTLHHYCWGLINLRRAQAAGVTAKQRNYLLGTVVDDYGFVIKNTSAHFVLLPEIYTRLGEVQLVRGNVAEAFDAFTKARELKPDYWPPYVRWAEVLIRAKRTAEAKGVIAEGLRHSPDSAPLLEKYRALGGNPGDIRPAASGREREPQQVAPAPTASSASEPRP
jgi:hypothetical protein